MVVYPFEWDKYMVDGKVRTFRADTPASIIRQAQKINERSMEVKGKPHFFFEGQTQKN